MYRIIYLLAMYTGTRATINRIRSLFLPRPCAAILDGHTLQLDETNKAKVRVHSRAPSKVKTPDRIAGMISVYLVSPGLHRTVYALWRLTSHFGCGHIELAFYEERGIVHVYAVRNILRSNMERIGGKRLGRRLKFCRDRDEILVLKRILQALADRGLQVVLVPPEESVALAVSESLLDPKQCRRCKEALQRKYVRIARQAKAPFPDSPMRAVHIKGARAE